MEVFLNSEPKEIQEGDSLQLLINNQGWGAKKGIAVAIDNVVIPKNSWESQELKQGNKITIIQAFQGG